MSIVTEYMDKLKFPVRAALIADCIVIFNSRQIFKKCYCICINDPVRIICRK